MFKLFATQPVIILRMSAVCCVDLKTKACYFNIYTLNNSPLHIIQVIFYYTWMKFIISQRQKHLKMVSQNNQLSNADTVYVEHLETTHTETISSQICNQENEIEDVEVGNRRTLITNGKYLLGACDTLAWFILNFLVIFHFFRITN